MNIPDCLKPFEADLQHYKQDFIRIHAKPLKKNPQLTFEQSKFLGKPYLPVGFEYPMDQNDEPMILLAQINFAEVPALENYPDHGILQLFVSGDDWEDMEDYKVLFHETIGEAQTDFSFVHEDLYATSPINCPHSLTFTKETELGGSEDFRFDYEFDGKPYWEFEDTLKEADQEAIDPLFSGSGHKIGGYACFTQLDPRDEKEENRDDVLLLQIDIDDEIMFGDSGVAHLLINKDALINKDFSKAYFYWDCC